MKTFFIALAGLAAGFVLAVGLFLDPLDLHAFDERLRGVEAHEDETSDDGQLWTCGMHPQVIQDEPGTCPICQMELVPMAGGVAADDHAGHGHPPLGEGSAELWTCPIHPGILEPEAGSCPICGTDLVPAETPEKPETAGVQRRPVVRIDPAALQAMNVETTTAERRDIARPIRSVGYLEYDQDRMVSVTTKYSGWVEKVYVNYVGEEVLRGQPLFEVYSPELVQTQQELLSALDFARRMETAPEDTRRRARSLVEAAKTRLSYWDISPEQIEELIETGEVFRTLEVVAPAGGQVMKRLEGFEGTAIKPGMEAYHIADLSQLWLAVEVFEDQVAWIDRGTPAEVTFTYFPGETFRGAVRFVEPEFSERTRTLKVKIAMPNPEGRLRSGMFATVVFRPEAVKDALAVPSQAVLRTGTRNVVVVDLGDGRFAPREVVLGHEGEGFVEVRSGLEAGQRVVVSSQFLIDSESSLRQAIQRMAASRAGG